MGAVVRRAVAAAHRASLARPARRFRRALEDPAAAQRERLSRTLRALEGSAYARAHRLAPGLGGRAFRERAPVVGWDEVAPWVARAAAGEPDVLAPGLPLAFERSGGATGGGKLVPLTRPLLEEFAAAVGPWMRDLYARHPALAAGGAQYWAVSPVAQEPGRTPGGIRVGLGDESEYLGPVARAGLRRLLAVPPDLARERDVARWRRATASLLVAEGDLALVSVWSPTFLLLLLDEVEASLETLLDEAPRRRAGDVRAALARGRTLAQALWPRLAVVSAWADGPSAAYVPELRRRVPHAALEPKGLLATEGVVSVPLGAGPPVAAVASHVLELDPLDAPGPPVPVHEAAHGARYAPVLTTGAGLVRYRLPDAVRCVGGLGGAPRLAFEGRLDRGADLVGEKVSQGQAGEALRRAWEKTQVAPAFALLAPSRDGRPHYRLFAETDAPRALLDAAAEVVDAALAEAHPYAYARRLGQLGPVRAVRVRGGRAAWERAHAGRGRRLGALKPDPLEPDPVWDDVFEAVP